MSIFHIPRQPSRGFTKVELAIVITIIVILALAPNPRGGPQPERVRVARLKSDLRSLATAINSYDADEGAFPPGRPVQDWLRSAGPHAPAAGLRPGMMVPPNLLTTPTAYLTSLFSDLTAKGPKGLPPLYIPLKTRFVLMGAGPDGDYDLVPPYDWLDGPSAEVETRLAAITYDATNGLVSNGDILRLEMRNLSWNPASQP